MTRLALLTGAVLLAAATQASASSFIATTDTLGNLTANASESTSDMSSFKDNKIVRAARDDAASYVGSDGAIRGAQLEAALHYIRSELPQLEADDQQLARAILTL